MSTECGPWRSCDFHQYRSWLRKADCSTPTSSNPPDKDKQKVKKVRRRPAPGEYQLTFRHHGDPAEYERDYLTQVTHARCRASNPSATLLATELTSVRSSASDRSVVQLLPPRSCVSTESQPLTATAAAAAPAGGTGQPRDTASTPDLSGDSASPPPRPTPPSSSPDLCQVSGRAAGGRPARRRRSLPPSAAASGAGAGAGAGAPPGTAAAASRPAVRQPSFQPPAAAAVAAAVAAVRHARSMSVQRGDETDALPSPSAPLTPGQRRQPAARQPSTPHTVTLDLAGPAGLGGAAHLRRTAHKPRGLTKIQLASSVPENLTIIVGRKLEISLSGAKRGRQKGGKAFR